jgi:hypothetical protein
VGAFLVRTHQARIAHHIGGEDRGETAVGGRSGHCSGSANACAEFNLFRGGKAPISCGRVRSNRRFLSTRLIGSGLRPKLPRGEPVSPRRVC